MPIVVNIDTIESITRPEDLVEFLCVHLGKMPQPLLGKYSWQYIAKYDEKLIPKYPALHIMAADFRKALHSTNNFAVELHAVIHVLHSNFNKDRQTRSYEDLQLATAVVDYLESDMTFWNATLNKPRIVHGFVDNEVPGVLPPRVTKGEAVISTRLNWMGLNLRSFK